MILVTGATGHLGNLVINSLLEKGFKANKISALVRNVEKTEDLRNKGINLRLGSYDEIAKYISEIIDVLSGFSLTQEQGDLGIVSTDLENLLSRKPTSLKEFLKTTDSSKN